MCQMTSQEKECVCEECAQLLDRLLADSFAAARTDMVGDDEYFAGYRKALKDAAAAIRAIDPDA